MAMLTAHGKVQAIVNDIKALLDTTDEYVFCCVIRHANRAADWVVKNIDLLCFNPLWVVSPPIALKQILYGI